ncbi:MAG: hypothetical protein V1889_01920 [archaeon]
MKITKLYKYFERKDGEALRAYSAHSRKDHKYLSDEDLIEIRKIRGTAVSKICDKIVEYRRLTGKRDTPFYAERFLRTNGRLVNLINAELAWRTYSRPRTNINPENI